MIEVLKNKVQEKLGVIIKNRGDCQFLSDAILEELGETINYNTLRRFFGIDKRAQFDASRNTLNILAKFLGYGSYNEFSRLVVRSGANQYSDQWFAILNEEDSERIIAYLSAKRIQGKDFTEVFIRAVRELILLRRIKEVDRIFKSDLHRQHEFNYSESVHIGNAIGILLRDVELSPDEYNLLAKNKAFVQMVLSIFVDYSSLNSNYGVFVRLMETECDVLDENDRIFFTCVNYLRLYLLKKRPQFQLGIDITSHDSHPILIGRIAAVDMLENTNNQNERKRIFETLRARYGSEKIKRIDYFYEVKIAALILADFELMQLLKDIREERNMRQHYQISHFQLGCLIQLLLAVKNEDEEVMNEMQSHIKQDLWVKSYYYFFDLFYNLAMFHAVKGSDKKKFKAGYLKISRKLGFPYFDDRFLLTYFD